MTARSSRASRTSTMSSSCTRDPAQPRHAEGRDLPHGPRLPGQHRTGGPSIQCQRADRGVRPAQVVPRGALGSNRSSSCPCGYSTTSSARSSRRSTSSVRSARSPASSSTSARSARKTNSGIHRLKRVGGGRGAAAEESADVPDRAPLALRRRPPRSGRRDRCGRVHRKPVDHGGRAGARQDPVGPLVHPAA